MSDGVLYVEILPSTKGIGRAVTGDMDKALGQSEQRSAGFFGKFAKWGTVAVAGVAAGIAAISLKGGVSRALNIEDAQAKLKGLGHDTQAVEAIMKDALGSVKGTAFGLDTAATVAASAVAAGIKPGKELEGYLRLTADAATIAGISMDEMGSIMNKVQTNGRAMTENLNQLSDRGIPILQWLAEEYGVTTEEMSKMVSQGKVDAETFNKVLQDNIGGAALASGETTRGAFANMMAAFSRLGAMFAGPGLETAKAFFGEITELVDGIGERIQPLTDVFANMLGGIDMSNMAESILGFFDNFDIGSVIAGAMEARGNFIEVGLGVAQSLLEGLIQAVPQVVQGAADLVTRVLDMIVQYGPSLLTSAVQLFVGLVEAVVQVAPQLIATVVALIPQLITTLAGMLPALIATGIELFLGLVASLTTIIPQLITAITGLLPVIITALVEMIPTLLLAAVDLFIQLVQAIPVILPQLITSIIGMLPTIITALVGMIPQLMTGAVDLFMGIVEALPEMIPALIEALVGLGPAMVEAIVGIIPELFDAGKALIQGLIDGVGEMFGAVGEAFGGVMDFVGGFFPHSPAKRGPFSGAGWTQLGKSGGAIVDELLGGLEDGFPALQASMNHMVAIPQGLVGAAASTTRGGPVITQENNYAELDPTVAAELAKQQMAAIMRGA